MKKQMLLHQVLIWFLYSHTYQNFWRVEEKDFNLLVNIEEENQRSVETNQATSNLRYELRFTYTRSSVKLHYL